MTLLSLPSAAGLSSHLSSGITNRFWFDNTTPGKLNDTLSVTMWKSGGSTPTPPLAFPGGRSFIPNNIAFRRLRIWRLDPVSSRKESGGESLTLTCRQITLPSSSKGIARALLPEVKRVLKPEPGEVEAGLRFLLPRLLVA